MDSFNVFMIVVGACYIVSTITDAAKIMLEMWLGQEEIAEEGE